MEIENIMEDTSIKKPDALVPSVSFFKLFSFADMHDYLLMALGTVGAMGHGLALPMFFYFFGKLINSFGANMNNPDHTAREVSKYALDLVYMGLVIWASSWAEVACWMHTGQRQVSRLRRAYLQAILSQEISFFDTDGQTGMLVDSLCKDTILIQEAISEKLGNSLHFLATFAGGYGVGFSTSWKLTLVTMAVIPAIAFAGGLYAYTLTRLSTQSHEAYSDAGAIAEQSIAQIRTVYSFVGEEKAQSSFSQSLATTLKLGYKGGAAKGLGLGTTYTILFLSWALILWYGSIVIRKEEVDGGNAIGAIFSCIIGGIALGQAMSNVPFFSKGKAAAQNIFSILDKPLKMDRQKDHGSTLDNVKGDIDLRSIVFSYPSRPDVRIFNGFSLSIASGKTVALVGGSGSGKSTVISLIERFYDPIAGQVLLDGHDVRSLQLRWLRDQIGLVNQEPALFATSILENILYGKEGGTMEEVETAAKAANAHDFISELPLGYETQVGDRGVQLSGGQKQRVAIARAMLRSPKVLLLDEATSALDAASERVVQDTLDRLMVGRTTVIIAHRLSTIRNVDTIGVVHEGKIVEMGSHDELIGKGELGAYAMLVKLQEKALSSDGTLQRQYTWKAVRNSSGRVNSAAYQLSKNRSAGSDRNMQSYRKTSNVSDINLEMLEEGEVVVEEATANSGNLFWRIARLNAPEWPYVLLGSVGAMLAGFINPIFAYLIANMLEVYYYTDTEKMKKGVEKYTLVFVGTGVASIAIYLLQHYYFGIVGENLTARVRELMFTAIMRNEVGWFDLDENNSKRLSARLSTDATHVRAALGDRISLFVQNTTVFMTACAIGLFVEWRLALVLIATLPITVGAFLAQQLCVTGFSGNLDKAYTLSSMIAGDAIGNIRTVAAFNAEDKVTSFFSAALRGPAKRSLLRGNLSGGFYGFSQMCMFSSYGLVLWYGSQLVKDGTSDFGSIIKVFMVLMVTAFAVAETLGLAPDLVKGNEALVSVFEILDRHTRISPDDRNSEMVTSLRGKIALRDIEFCYPARPDVTIFKGFNLSVNEGDSLALVGSSGSGKSTVISLVERFYDPLRGEVLIDGKNIKHLQLRSLRRHIGLVQQEPALFATSIYNNILYGKDGATQAEVEAAAQAANAHVFITALPDGYRTQVGERGVQLSGGQKQRVAIARAVLKNPSILLLDESTSALDAESEKIVQGALDKLMQGRTTIVVAHRLSTIRNAESIAVVQDGRIIEQGTHDQLMSKSDGSYAHLVNIQRARDGKKN